MGKRTRTLGTKTSGRQGYDFGAELHALIVPGPDLIPLLTHAGVCACAYGSTRTPEIPRPLPLITLVGTDAQQMSSAFQEFHRWAANGGGDAVELTFVFLKNGGYLLGISPETNRSLQRLCGYDRVYSPLTVMPIWVKQFDTRQSFLLEFQKYKEHLISPFLFAAAVTTTIPEPNMTPDSIKALPDVVPLLKFEATIQHEDQVKENTVARLALRVAVKKHLRPPNSRKRKPDPRDYAKRREEITSRHFPLTIERVRAKSFPEDVRRESEDLQIRSWQLEQAICNLTLSKEMCVGLSHYSCVGSRKQLAEQIPSPDYS